MKKQNPTVKAQIIRSAFILLSLLAVCAIPFALAQRNSTKRSRFAGTSQSVSSQLPIVWSSQISANPAANLANPALPEAVLYDQYNNDSGNGIVSANRPDAPTSSAEAADNFVVPSGQTWTITEVDIRSPGGFPSPTSFAVTFYTDNGSGLPGMQVYTARGLAVVGNPDYTILLTTPAVLTAGTYWVSAVGTITGSNWYWEGRSITDNTYSTAWRNPGGGFGVCPTWSVRTSCIGDANALNQMFRLIGTPEGIWPTYTFSSTTGTLVPGVTDIGNHCDDCSTSISLPFPVSIYGATYTTAFAGSNGHLTFGTPADLFSITCSPFGFSGATYVLAPYWTDQCTGTCGGTACSGCGIFTITAGTAPNRVFYVEYRTNYFPNPGQTTALLDYEVALYENGSPPFSYIYSSITAATVQGNSELVIGVKLDETHSTQYWCDPNGGTSPGVSNGQQLNASYIPCTGTPTATPTATNTPTPTPTPTASPSPTPTPVLTPRPPPSRFTPTPTATGTPSPTPTPILTPRPTPSRFTPTPTATGTPSPTPTPILTPRPRSSPRPRP